MCTLPAKPYPKTNPKTLYKYSISQTPNDSREEGGGGPNVKNYVRSNGHIAYETISQNALDVQHFTNRYRFERGGCGQGRPQEGGGAYCRGFLPKTAFDLRSHGCANKNCKLRGLNPQTTPSPCKCVHQYTVVAIQW